MESESYAMIGGEGPNSYAHNSTLQRDTIKAGEEFIKEAIAKNFNHTFLAEPTRPICIADLGCSTGPNTFIAMQSIIDAIDLQFQSKGLAAQMPEFQVFFNDHVLNDFNTLYKNLPPNKKYFAAGVPGSFHGRLFPKATLHFVHSSSSLFWLSKVPKEIMDKSSSAWNKGRIHHLNAPKGVIDAYEAQYKVDLENFLNARAEEVVENGLMLLQFPVVTDMILDSDVHPSKPFEIMGSCLLEMAKEGLISEEKVDNFNMPFLYAPNKKVKAILRNNGFFRVKKIKLVDNKDAFTIPSTKVYVSTLRAGLEELFAKNFGEEIIDELFNRFTEKVEEFPDVMNQEKLRMGVTYALLERKPKCNNKKRKRQSKA